MTRATDAPARVAGAQRVRIGLDVGKGLGTLDGIGRYTRGLLAGLREVEAELPPAERFEYVLFPLFRCARVIQPGELLGGEAAPNGSFRFVERPAPSPGEVDLFHATAWALPAAYRGPVALTLYDLTFTSLAERHTRENRAHCLIGLARALARGGALCAISASVRDQAARWLGLDAASIGVAAPAVDPGFRPQPAEAIERARAELSIDRPYVLAVGTREPRKNLPRLLEAWSLLPRDLRECRLLVLAGGEGWSGSHTAEPIDRLAERLGVAAEVRALGHVPDALLPALYAGASVFAYPSLGEGFGLPPLEAMACGTPVVASDRPALPEVLGDAAVLVDPESPQRLADAIAELLAETDRAHSLREAGWRRVERYTWRRTAEAVRDLWRRLLERPAAGPG